MIEAVRTAVILEGEELLELEGILAGHDAEKALAFLKECIYDKVARIQRAR